MALCIFISTRLMRERFRLRWYDVAVGAAGVGLGLWNLKQHMVGGVFHPELPYPRTFEWKLASLWCCSIARSILYRYAHRKNSLAFTLLAMSLALWSVLMLFGQFSNSYLQLSDLLGPIPQMSLGIAMVMVLAENERNAVQENALAFSTLGVDPTRLLSAEDLVPSMQSILDRLVAPLPAGGPSSAFRSAGAPCCLRCNAVFLRSSSPKLEKSGAGEYVCELAYRRGGFVTFRSVPEMPEPLPAFPGRPVRSFARC